MFLAIALILTALWAIGFYLFPVTGVLIHILLVLAIISLLWHFIARPNTRP
jgi:hypothetical protein